MVTKMEWSKLEAERDQWKAKAEAREARDMVMQALEDKELRDAFAKEYVKEAVLDERDEALMALASIIEIGKRDLTNPKYDGYFENARAILVKYKLVEREDAAREAHVSTELEARIATLEAELAEARELLRSSEALREEFKLRWLNARADRELLREALHDLGTACMEANVHHNPVVHPAHDRARGAFAATDEVPKALRDAMRESGGILNGVIKKPLGQQEPPAEES